MTPRRDVGTKMGMADERDGQRGKSQGAGSAGSAGIAEKKKSRAEAEIDDLFDELDMLLKNAEAGAVLAEKGVNVSLAIVAADGLRAYLHGDKARAAEELSTAAEEITTRMQASKDLAKGKLS